MNFLIVAGALLAIVVLAGWPWIFDYTRALLQHLGIAFAKVGVLTWSEPTPEAQGTYLRFTGVELGHRFFGMVTSQEAYVETPKKPLIEVVS